MRVWMLLALMAAPVPLAAQDSGGQPPAPAGPICRAQIEGQLSCQANRVCECVFSRAVPARGLPDRWRWDCSILRPMCRIVPPDTGRRDDFMDYSDFLILNPAGEIVDRVVDGRVRREDRRRRRDR